LEAIQHDELDDFLQQFCLQDLYDVLIKIHSTYAFSAINEFIT